jgi:competence protein CoiA
MQLHALDHLGQVINAQRALRQKNYICLECARNVRLRRGIHRQPHFYHLEPALFCRQHQKGAIHLQLQSYFFSQLPIGDCQLELRFPTIGRIADVAWLSKKIVFEIQYSAISAEEVNARNSDYQKLGWSVVWILHDQRYNRVRLSAAEIMLRSSPHFFSNMDESGRGMIYDQFDLCIRGLRYGRLPPLPIDLKEGIFFGHAGRNFFPLRMLDQRSKSWPYFFSGDLMSLFLNNMSKSPSDYLKQARQREAEFAPEKGRFMALICKFWRCGIIASYQTIFRFLLERVCR